MLTKQLVGVIACALLLSPVQLLAQPQRGWSGGSGSRHFFEIMQELQRQHPNRELIGILHWPQVREAIGLSEADWTQVNALMKQMLELGEGMHRAFRDKKLSDNEVRKQFAEKILPVEQQILKTLQSDSDYQLLLRIFAQHRDFAAAAIGPIAELIGLEGDELADFRKMRSSRFRELMTEHRDDIRSLIRKQKRDEIGEIFKRIDRELDNHLKGYLTAQQQEAMLELRGEELPIVRELARQKYSRPPGSGRSGGRAGGGRGEGEGGKERGREGGKDRPRSGERSDCSKCENAA